jgi:large subunit ribosomal protein L14
MIQLRSRIKVVDNTGAKDIACFKILNHRSQKQAVLGDTIMASVKVAKPHGQIKKKEVVKAIIIRQRAPLQRADGTTIRFDDNAAVIVDNDGNPKGTKIAGPVAREVRNAGYTKIISLSQEVL